MKILSRLSGIALLLFGLCWPATAQIGPRGGGAFVVAVCGTLPLAYKPGAVVAPTQDINGNACSAASVTASIGGFHTESSLTPITATTGGVSSAAFTAGKSVLASNTGATNTAFCAPGASATTSSTPILPGQTVELSTVAETAITCITSASTTTVSFQVGTGLATGWGGSGSGGGGGGAATIASGADVVEGSTGDAAVASTVRGQLKTIAGASGPTSWAAGTLGAMANYGTSPGAVLVPGMNAFVTNTVTVGTHAVTVASGGIASGGLASGAMVDLVALSAPVAPATATATKS